MFKLYYLVDQSGEINGDKTLVGIFSDLPSAQAQANTDQMAHYSVEQTLDNVIYSIVFSC